MQSVSRKQAFTIPVSIGTIEGTSEKGCLREFSPALHSLILEKTDQEDRHRLQFSAERLTYVAFEQLTDQQPSKTNEDLKLHLVGNKTFHVRVNSVDLAHPLGFYAYPAEPNAPYKMFYFYSWGIRSKENPAPLGELLLATGDIKAEQLHDGVQRQAADRKMPIGQILLQLQKVTSQDIDHAQKLQQRQKLRIGEVLLELGLISQEDIEKALKEQHKRRGKRLGEVLVELGIIEEQALFRTLARKFHMPFIDLDEVDFSEEAANHVPKELIKKFRVLPLDYNDGRLTVAISDPLRTEVYDALRFHRNFRLQEVLATPSQLEKYVTNFLNENEQTEVGAILDVLEAEVIEDQPQQKSDLLESDSAIVRLANQLIRDAVQAGTSDIHIEPNGKEQNTIIRFRVDGKCSIYQGIHPSIRSALVARLKVMADLDISERRKPQDGKIKFSLGQEKVELRVATIPTVHGDEDVVMRILAKAKPMPIDEMGLSSRNLAELKQCIVRPYGLVLCVGPTGSGKTTTLHAALGHINKIDRKIWTAEDPVEITQSGLRQVQVRPKIGFTFATAMRAFLRADPDVIMIGEMRDLETASIAIEASLTGHLVLSTLHTNTAPETVSRILDMGLDPLTFADALLCVLAQRLARSLCKSCRTQREAEPSEYDQIVNSFGEENLRKKLGITESDEITLWYADGCANCKNSGLKGRVALHELLVNNDELQHLIQTKAPAHQIRNTAIQNGMTTLLQDGVIKSISGKTELQQVLAVCAR